jgi:hypothetical protein
MQLIEGSYRRKDKDFAVIEAESHFLNVGR